MRAVIGEILPLALVVTLSPLNIIPSILLLFIERPVRTASMFLAGFTLGVAAVLGGLVAIVSSVNLAPGTGGSTAASVVKLLLGMFLLVEAVRKFRHRPRDGEAGELPKWMDGLTGFSPAQSLKAGAVLGVANPKNIVVALAAAMIVSAGSLTTAQQVVACAIYVAVGVLGVAAPIVAMLVLGDRSAEVLDGWKIWLRHNNPTVMAVLFFVFGVVLIGQGIAGT